MRIGVVADTHMPQFGVALPRELHQGLVDASVELILHLGDITGAEIPALFEAIAPFDAVAGNNDGPDLLARFGRHKIVDVEGIRIGMTHGDLGTGATTPQRAIRTFGPQDVEVVLFGHSHTPLLQRLDDGRWLLNPGSPTSKRRQPRYSWALLDLRSARDIRPELRFFDDRSP
jgi:putative phosphoesterase